MGDAFLVVKEQQKKKKRKHWKYGGMNERQWINELTLSNLEESHKAWYFVKKKCKKLDEYIFFEIENSETTNSYKLGFINLFCKMWSALLDTQCYVRSVLSKV